MKKSWLRWLCLGAVPLCALLGATVFGARSYAFVSLAAALGTCGYFFFSFEEKAKAPARLVLTAVMTVLSVTGRFVFAAVPGFKPVTAVVVLAGLYMGPESGFVCGAFSAFISNFYFGQGPWTPFQMLAWGLIGLLAGLLSRWLTRSRWALSAFGVFAGIFFSMVMDVWSVLWMDNTFNLARYAAAVASALPFTVMYAVSNVVFLLLLEKPLGSRLGYVVKKYGLRKEDTP